MPNFNFTEGGYMPSYDFNFGTDTQVIFNILGGTSNNFVAIWADPTASLTSGKMQTSSAEAFSIINLDNGSLYDLYMVSRRGQSGEVLESDTVIDINVA